MKVYVEKFNEVFLRVYSSPDVEAELSEHFKLEVPGAKYTPQYKAGLWNGFAYLYSLARKTLYVGLLHYLRDFCQRNQYELEITGQINLQDQITREQIEAYVKELNLHSRGKPIETRDYQIDTIHHALNNFRAIAKSPTSSGKSLNLYALIRWHLDNNRRVLLITPRSSLVEQMYSDFEDYSSANGWDVSQYCQKLYSGFTKFIEKPVLISTWQSLHPLAKKGNWLQNQNFDVVMVDECHTAASASLIGIMEKLPYTQYRLGTTGTVANTKTALITLEGLFGPVYQAITTKELMDRKQVSQLKIKSLVLKYPPDFCKVMCKTEYQTEMDFLVSLNERNKFICNLALATKGNTLILCHYVEKHSDILHEMIQEKAGNRPVYYVHGKVSVEEREKIRGLLEQQDNVILVSTFGTFSTGVNAPSIENIIFASPSKSAIRVLQSVGRGLRLKEGKSHCTLFDISDVLSWKNKHNHTIRHSAERFKLYSEQQFQVSINEINLFSLQ